MNEPPEFVRFLLNKKIVGVRIEDGWLQLLLDNDTIFSVRAEEEDYLVASLGNVVVELHEDGR